MPAVPSQHHRVGLQVGQPELPRGRQLRIHAQQRENAATRTAGHDALQPMGRHFGEIGGKIGHHQHAVRLRHLPGKTVVLLDRLELVAQIDLDDVLHVVGQVGQPLLDVAGVGPDAAGHQLLVVIGQVHEGGEVFAQPDRIEDREADFARRHRRQHAQHDRLDRRTALARPSPAAFSSNNERRGKGNSAAGRNRSGAAAAAGPRAFPLRAAPVAPRPIRNGSPAGFRPAASSAASPWSSHSGNKRSQPSRIRSTDA